MASNTPHAYYQRTSNAGSEVALNDYGSDTYKRGPAAYSPVGRKSNAAAGLNKKWVAIGAVALLIVAGAVVGGVVGSRSASKSSNSNAANAADRGVNNAVVGGTTALSVDANGNPIYPSSTATAAGSTPTVVSNSALSCGTDPYTPSGGSGFTARSDHPRLFAPQYRWDCLPKLIAADPYLATWNETIFVNATRYAAMDPQAYV